MSTPYSRDEVEIARLLKALVRDDECLFFHGVTNADLGSCAVFRVDATDELADLGRTLEATTFAQSAGYETDFIETHFALYDRNSFFFLLVDQRQQDEPQLVGGLRVIDCNAGDCETVSMFHEFYGDDTPLPPQLSVSASDEIVWDILSVVVDPEFRTGEYSAWLYHALYQSSLDRGVQRWLTNMTPAETRNLRQLLGLPVEQVPGVDPVEDVTPGGKTATYGFYTVDVASIRAAVNERIASLDEAGRGRLARIARIGLNGGSGGRGGTWMKLTTPSERRR